MVHSLLALALLVGVSSHRDSETNQNSDLEATSGHFLADKSKSNAELKNAGFVAQSSVLSHQEGPNQTDSLLRSEIYAKHIPEHFWGYVAHRAPTGKAKSSFLEKKNPTSIVGLSYPDKEPYILSTDAEQGKSFSQWGQDKVLSPILSQIKDGFFVESGARDGETDSNSLFYELLGWRGLLVEPSETEFPELLQKHRKAYAYQGCISPTKQSETLHFQYAGGGLGHVDKDSSFTVQCQPLVNLLTPIQQSTVDFWSLDIEGSEGAVLEATDFDRLEVGLLLIEMNKTPENNKAISKVMKRNGFLDIGTTKYPEGDLDHVFVNPKYFERRGLSVPRNLTDRQ